MRLRYFLNFLIVAYTAFFTFPMLAQPILAPKQLIIVKPGIDKLHGTWLAAVINRDEKPQSLRIPVLLPKETEDFRPVEGISDKDVTMTAQGVFVEKDFAPGVNVISFTFMTSSQSGSVDLNFEAKQDLGELTVMTPRGMMQVQGERLVRSGTDVQDLQTFDLWVTKSPVVQGDAIKVTIMGVPEGRRKLWILGTLFGVVLVFSVAGLTYWSHQMSHRHLNSGMVSSDI